MSLSPNAAPGPGASPLLRAARGSAKCSPTTCRAILSTTPPMVRSAPWNSIGPPPASSQTAARTMAPSRNLRSVAFPSPHSAAKASAAEILDWYFLDRWRFGEGSVAKRNRAVPTTMRAIRALRRKDVIHSWNYY